MHYCVVTALYELKDGINRRNIQKYIECLSYLHGLKVPVFLFTDMVERLKPIYPNFKYMELERDQIPIYHDIMNSNAKTIECGFDTTTKIYSVITIAKSYFVDLIRIANPDFTHYVWMDAAIACHSPIPYEDLEVGLKLHDKPLITVMQMRSIKQEEKQGKTLLSCNKGIIAASIFMVPKELTAFLWEQSVEAVKLMLQHDYLCLDEQVLAYINAKHPEFFDYWFSDYGTLLNIRYITIDHRTVMQNMIQTEDNEHACKIGLALLDSMEFTYNYPKDLVAETLYYLHIKSYYAPHITHKGIALHVLTAKLIHYLHYYYKIQFPENTITNVAYSGITLTDAPKMDSSILCFTKFIR